MRMLFCAIVATEYLGYCVMRASPWTAGLAPVVVSDVVVEAAGTTRPLVLLDDLGDDTGPDRAATLPDGEAQALVHGDRLDHPNLPPPAVAPHDHVAAPGDH